MRRALGPILVLVLGTACAQPVRERPPPQEPGYVPGLGEIMSGQQMRHIKLWYAARAGNWPLASYEVDELEEGFAEAERLHPHHAGAPRPLPELIPEFTAAPLTALREAIAKHSEEEFASAYDGLTDGCNGCHAAAGFAFNVLTRPRVNPYGDQRFEPPE